ncbi:hypothetical protein DM02DRAFT_673589 [Periconia macrospinosa]|uniref:NAD(P)-binding domain-containing protein n=1 Tax=Periconia macrospinosa TaxID=97972 RepID=A0A2V1DKI3_9PLEO|nr:hypothetical protein DM02DRAFT_673589 [Periconia macrospinosa]
MHVLLTGATGHIGSTILVSLLTQHPHITHITTITRRPFTPPSLPPPPPPTTHTSHTPPTHTNIVLDTFTSWPPHILSQIAHADAMIWAMGNSTPDPEVNFNYPRVFIESFLPLLAPKPNNKKFQFMYLSGALASPSQTAPLYFMPAARRVKGRFETFALEFAARNDGVWSSWVLRPGGVYKEGSWMEWTYLHMTFK